MIDRYKPMLYFAIFLHLDVAQSWGSAFSVPFNSIDLLVHLMVKKLNLQQVIKQPLC